MRGRHQLAEGEAAVVVEVSVVGVNCKGGAEVLDSCGVAAEAVVGDAAVVQRVAAARVHLYRCAVVRQRRLILTHLHFCHVHILDALLHCTFTALLARSSCSAKLLLPDSASDKWVCMADESVKPCMGKCSQPITWSLGSRACKCKVLCLGLRVWESQQAGGAGVLARLVLGEAAVEEGLKMARFEAQCGSVVCDGAAEVARLAQRIPACVALVRRQVGQLLHAAATSVLSNLLYDPLLPAAQPIHRCAKK